MFGRACSNRLSEGAVRDILLSNVSALVSAFQPGVNVGNVLRARSIKPFARPLAIAVDAGLMQIQLWAAAMLVGVLAGVSPASGTCPVPTVVISGGGAGDQSAESPDVKVLVGWAKAWPAPTGGRASRQVVAQANRS